MTHRGRWTAVLLPGLFCAATVAQEGPASPEAIARWIRELDDDSFAQRQAASRQLQNAGAGAVEALAETVRGSSLEAAERALQLLDQASFSPDPLAARAAKAALQSLADSPHRASAKAKRVLRSRVTRAAEALQLSGVILTTQDERVFGANLDSAEKVAAHLHLLHELPDLQRLSLATEQFDDAGMAELKGLPQVTDLNLFQSRIGDAGLAHLKTLPKLRRVPMGLTRVTDAGLAHLKDLTDLEYLGLRGNAVTDVGLEHLQGLTNLSGLYLGETKVTDAGLVHLKRLKKLTLLRLDKTEVSDAGLEHLHSLAELQSVDLSQTRVTADGAERLQKALPNVRILRETP